MDAAMGMMGLGITLTLRDRASSAIDKLREKMTGLRDVSEQMAKRFDAGVKQMMGGLGMMYAGGKMLSAVNNAVGASVTVAANFEQAMARVQAVSGATGKEFEALSAQAKQLGRDTQFSASQVASAQELLARAGFKALEGNNEIIAAMPGLLNMASAEGMGLAEAADIAAGTLRGFGMEANEMNRVANVLAKGSAISNVSIATLGEALRNVAPDAKRLGLSLEETVAMLGALGDSAIKGGRAGTALSSMMAKIASPVKAAKQSLDELGVVTTKNGNLLNFNVILDQINKSVKAKGLGTAQIAEHLKNIFGLTTQTEATVLMDALGIGKTGELTEKLRSAGDAAGDMSKVMNDTLQGAMLRLESASEGLSIAIGSIFKDSYRWGIEKLAEFKGWLTGLIEDFPFLSKLIIGGTGAIVAFGGAALVAGGALLSIGGMVKMWPMIVATMTSGFKATMSLLPGLREGISLFKIYRSYGHTVNESLQFLAKDAGNGLLGFFKAIPGKIGVILKAIPRVFRSVFKAIPGIIKGAFKVLWALPGPIKLLIGLGAALVAAWKTNFAGIRDMATAVSEGWKLAMSANAEGIANMDAETAARLKKAGLFDAAVNMSAVFWRIRQFWEGFVEGFSRGVDRIKSIFAAIADALTPVIDTGKAALEFLGILSPVAETASATWRDVGMAIGDSLVTVLSVIAAVKTVSAAVKAWTAAQWLLNSATFAWPGTWIILGIMGLVAAGYYLYQNWDTVKEKLLAAWDLVWDKVAAFWNWLKSFFTWDVVLDTWEYVKGAIAEGWEWLKGLFSWEWLSGAWQVLVDAWNGAESLVARGWNALKDSFLGDWAAGAWKTLTDGAAAAWATIKDGWNSVTSWIGSGLDSAWDGLVGAWDWAMGNDPAAREKMNDQEVMAAQVKDVTMLNKMSAGFADRVAEMSAAWEPFKSSLGSGFNLMFDVMARVGDNIKNTVIPAVNDLVSALSRVSSELGSISQAANINVKVNVPPVQAPVNFGAFDKGQGVKAHALGGIFSTPHVGLVAEDGPEAVVPIGKPSLGIPILSAAAGAMGMNVIPSDLFERIQEGFGAMPNAIPGGAGDFLGEPFTLNWDSAPLERAIQEQFASVPAPVFLPEPQERADSMPAFASLPAPSPNENRAAPYLAQMARNQAAFQGEAAARATSGDAEKPVKVENKLDVEVKAISTPVYLDGSLIGEFFTRFQAHESMRMGVPVTP